MTFLKVLLILALVLFLVSRIRLGGIAEFKEAVFSLRIIVGPLRIKLFPREKKQGTGKEDKRPKKKKEKEQAGKGDKGGEKPAKRKLPPVGDLIRIALEALGQLKRKIRLDDVTIHLTWASEDPADTATGFGKANALLGMIWPLIANNFNVKKHDLGVSVDFERTKPDIYARGSLTMTIGQLVSFGVRFGVKFLVLWSRSGKAAQKQQEGKNDERKQPSNQQPDGNHHGKDPRDGGDQYRGGRAHHD